MELTLTSARVSFVVMYWLGIVNVTPPGGSNVLDVVVVRGGLVVDGAGWVVSVAMAMEATVVSVAIDVVVATLVVVSGACAVVEVDGCAIDVVGAVAPSSPCWSPDVNANAAANSAAVMMEEATMPSHLPRTPFTTSATRVEVPPGRP